MFKWFKRRKRIIFKGYDKKLQAKRTIIDITDKY